MQGHINAVGIVGKKKFSHKYDEKKTPKNCLKMVKNRQILKIQNAIFGRYGRSAGR